MKLDRIDDPAVECCHYDLMYGIHVLKNESVYRYITLLAQHT
jgi:hypothetical protein